jgi:hypothetical protein
MRHFARYSFSTAIDLLRACFLVVRMRRLYRLNHAAVRVQQEGSPVMLRCGSG